MSALDYMDSETSSIVKECLKAAIDGPFFPDWEFRTLLGVDRETVKAVYEAWPEQTVEFDDFSSAVVGSMNNLIGYPHGIEQIWYNYISVPPERVHKALADLMAMGL